MVPSLVVLLSIPAEAAPHPVSDGKVPAKNKTQAKTGNAQAKTDGAQAKTDEAQAKTGNAQAKTDNAKTKTDNGLPPGYHPANVLAKAKRLRAKRQINQAIAEIDKGLKIRRDPALLWEQANCLYEMERLPEAIKALEESVESPSWPDQYKKLAECYLGMNRIDKAEDALTRGLKKHPKSAVLFMERATVAFASKDYADVLSDLAQAEKYCKLGVDERRSRAKSLQKLGRYTEAAAQFRKLRSEKLHNGEADTMGLLECLLQLKTHPDEVIAIATESIENSTSLMQGAFLRMRARAYRQKGKPKAALADEANADKLDFDLEPGMIMK